jgi:uncharacterized protein (DUF488 family)
MPQRTTIFTIGHSNHSWAEFVALLRAHGVTAVADVRSQPVSRRHPHFNRGEMEPALRDEEIAYAFLGDQLGGRPGQPSLYDSDGRVDYERVRRTPFFQRGLERLEQARQQFTIALLCSEEDPLHCHRGLMIAPALVERGIAPGHIRGDASLETMKEMEDRLLLETRVGEGVVNGLFAAILTDAEQKELLQLAYGKMARKMAFRENAPRSADDENG